VRAQQSLYLCQTHFQFRPFLFPALLSLDWVILASNATRPEMRSLALGLPGHVKSRLSIWN
jgi:hypothetical protein